MQSNLKSSLKGSKYLREFQNMKHCTKYILLSKAVHVLVQICCYSPSGHAIM